MKALVILPALLPHAVWAIPNIPKETDASDNAWDPQGWTPLPTDTPHLDLMKRNVEARSLSSGQLLGYLAPDNTCGWVNGALDAPVTCSVNSRCAAVAPISGIIGQFGCCEDSPTGDCLFYGTCYNSVDFYSSSACDHACQQQTNVILCTSAAKPYCYEYSIAGISATGFGCDTTTGLDTMSTTWIGETDGRTLIPVYNTDSSGASSLPLPTPISQSATTSTTASSTSSTGPATSTAPPSSGGSKTPVGAIVGGVVGGLAVVGAVIGVVIYMLFRKKKQPKDQTSQPPMAGQQQPYPPPGDNRMSYYTQDAKPPAESLNQPMSPNPTYMSNQQIPPQQMYPQQMPHQQMPPQQMPPQQMSPQQLSPQQLSPEQMPPQQMGPHGNSPYMYSPPQGHTDPQHGPPQPPSQHHFELPTN